MALVRINFRISKVLRDWIIQQPGVIRIVEESKAGGIIIEHNMTPQQAQDTKAAFIDKLIEAVN